MPQVQTALDALGAGRGAIVAAIDRRVLAIYDTAAAKRQGIAVAEARDGGCSGLPRADAPGRCSTRSAATKPSSSARTASGSSTTYPSRPRPSRLDPRPARARVGGRGRSPDLRRRAPRAKPRAGPRDRGELGEAASESACRGLGGEAFDLPRAGAASEATRSERAGEAKRARRRVGGRGAKPEICASERRERSHANGASRRSGERERV